MALINRARIPHHVFSYLVTPSAAFEILTYAPYQSGNLGITRLIPVLDKASPGLCTIFLYSGVKHLRDMDTGSPNQLEHGFSFVYGFEIQGIDNVYELGFSHQWGERTTRLYSIKNAIKNKVKELLGSGDITLYVGAEGVRSIIGEVFKHFNFSLGEVGGAIDKLIKYLGNSIQLLGNSAQIFPEEDILAYQNFRMDTAEYKVTKTYVTYASGVNPLDEALADLKKLDLLPKFLTKKKITKGCKIAQTYAEGGAKSPQFRAYAARIVTAALNIFCYYAANDFLNKETDPNKKYRLYVFGLNNKDRGITTKEELSVFIDVRNPGQSEGEIGKKPVEQDDGFWTKVWEGLKSFGRKLLESVGSDDHLGDNYTTSNNPLIKEIMFRFNIQLGIKKLSFNAIKKDAESIFNDQSRYLQNECNKALKKYNYYEKVVDAWGEGEAQASDQSGRVQFIIDRVSGLQNLFGVTALLGVFEGKEISIESFVHEGYVVSSGTFLNHFNILPSLCAMEAASDDGKLVEDIFHSFLKHNPNIILNREAAISILWDTNPPEQVTPENAQARFNELLKNELEKIRDIVEVTVENEATDDAPENTLGLEGQVAAAATAAGEFLQMLFVLPPGEYYFIPFFKQLVYALYTGSPYVELNNVRFYIAYYGIILHNLNRYDIISYHKKQEDTNDTGVAKKSILRANNTLYYLLPSDVQITASEEIVYPFYGAYQDDDARIMSRGFPLWVKLSITFKPMSGFIHLYGNFMGLDKLMTHLGSISTDKGEMSVQAGGEVVTSSEDASRKIYLYQNGRSSRHAARNIDRETMERLRSNPGKSTICTGM